MSAGIACRSIALHASGRCIYGIQSVLAPAHGVHGGSRSFRRSGSLGLAITRCWRGGGFRYDPDIAQLRSGLILLLRTGQIPLIGAGIGDLGSVQDMDQIGTMQVFVSKRPEDEVHDRRSAFDIWMIDHPA